MTGPLCFKPALSPRPLQHVVRQTIASGLAQDGLLHSLGHVDHHKIVRGVEVVFAALINDADISVLGSLVVREETVNLIQLQGGWVVGILDTDSKAWGNIVVWVHHVNPGNVYA